MNIISLSFFASVFFALILFYIIPKSTQWPFLLLLSVGFIYLNGSLARVAVFLLIGFVAYAGALLISRSSGKRRTVFCSLTVFLLAAILFVSKDLDFLNIPLSLARLLLGRGLEKTVFPVLQLIGMSYFTLSLIGYVLDVHWGKYLPETNYLKLLLFAGYFPQLTSGPITQYSDMAPQLFTPHSFDVDKVIMGAERAIWGCFKKMVLADRAAIFVNGVFDGGESSGLAWVVGTFVYAFQLYTDFSGCMDIILGISECFQITLPENFRAPFTSQSLGEFWRRWHITMGVWFKEYLLYPLMKTDGFQRINHMLRKKFGKKTGKKIATSLSLSVLWFVIGVWHGGSPVFICASGLIPGFFLILEEFLHDPIQNLLARLKVNTNCLSWRLVQRGRVFLSMCCSWIFIRSGSVAAGLQNIRSMFSDFNPWVLCNYTMVAYIDQYDWEILLAGCILLTVVGLLHEQGIHIREEFQKQNLFFRWGILLAALFIILIFGIYGPGYDAASFIYKNF